MELSLDQELRRTALRIATDYLRPDDAQDPALLAQTFYEFLTVNIPKALNAEG